MKQLPTKLRRLTKAEATRLGVSHKAKRRVDASLKTVSKRTKLYTDRDVAQSKLGTSKEKYTQYRTSKPNKAGAVTYRNVKQTEHFSLAKKVGTKDCQIIAFGRVEKKSKFGGSQIEGLDGGSDNKSIVSYAFPGDELRARLDRLYNSVGYLGFSASNPPIKVNVLVYTTKKVEF